MKKRIREATDLGAGVTVMGFRMRARKRAQKCVLRKCARDISLLGLEGVDGFIPL